MTCFKDIHNWVENFNSNVTVITLHTPSSYGNTVVRFTDKGGAETDLNSIKRGTVFKFIACDGNGGENVWYMSHEGDITTWKYHKDTQMLEGVWLHSHKVSTPGFTNSVAKWMDIEFLLDSYGNFNNTIEIRNDLGESQTISLSGAWICKNHTDPPPPTKPVCPECGGDLDEDGNCTNPDCGENPNPPPVTPPPVADQPPQVWGYSTNDMQDIKGHAGYSIPVSFRAWDDIGLIKFYYCEIKEPDSPNIEILRPFTPTKLAGFRYRFNLFKELEGTYQYKIIVYDTSMQRGESNTFNVVVEPPITPPSPPPTPPNVSDSEHIILYDKNANDFTSNGIGILDNDTLDYTVDKAENSTYELILKYLVDGKYVDELLDYENIIKCKSDMSGKKAQLFRIYDTQYDMKDNTLTVKAQHITYDLNEALVESVNLVDVTCKQATQTLMSKAIGNYRFVVESNITNKSNFKQERINVLECIIGVENSIFDVYGSSKVIIDRDNFNYTINTEKTNDNGVIIAYRKNMLGFKRTSNTRGVIAGIYPYAHIRNGSILRLKEKVVYSPNKSRYGTDKIKPIDFTSDTVTDENSLREAAKKYFVDGCDLPKLNYEVDFVQLYKSNPSKAIELRVLEDIALGDTVTVQDEKIGLSVKAKVIRTVYNRKKSKYTKIELGNFKNEYRTTKKNEQNNVKRIIRNVMN